MKVRPERLIGDELHIRCNGIFHQAGVYLPESEFTSVGRGPTGRVWRRRTCRRCWSEVNRIKRRAKTLQPGDPRGRVPAWQVRPYLAEIVYRTGSRNEAAKRIGTSHTSVLRWLGVTDRASKEIHRRSVAQIMSTLLELRREKVYVGLSKWSYPVPVDTFGSPRERGYNGSRHGSSEGSAT